MGNRIIGGTVDADGVITAGGAEVDPISRIEGHMGVKLKTDGSGYVDEANIHGNLWRGFENFLLGRDINDAITFTQRICGVCPVPHGMTSTYAVDAAMGFSRGHITFVDDGSYGVPAKAVHIRNLVLASEFLMSNLTHFYHLVALDYVQGPNIPPWTPWFANSYYNTYLQNPGRTLPQLGTVSGGNAFSATLWDATVTQYVKALRIRRLTFEAGALFAGRMPMTSCYVGGGVTNDYTQDLSTRCDKFKEITEEIGEFIVKEHVPLVLALGALYPNYDNLANATVLNTNYPSLWSSFNQDVGGGAPTATNTGWGAGCGNFLAWGAFPAPATMADISALLGSTKDELGISGGVIFNGTWYGGPAASPAAPSFVARDKTDVYNMFLGDSTSPNDFSMASNLTESIIQSRYDISDLDTGNINPTTYAGYPGDVQRTMPNRSRGYSYIKSPRWNGNVCEVGPQARMVVTGYVSADSTQKIVSTVPGAAALYAKAYDYSGIGGPNVDNVSVFGLDPLAIGADLAVACVRDGLAVLHLDDGAGTYTLVDDGTAGTNIDSLTEAAIVAAYTDARTTIGGVVPTWVHNIVGGTSVMDRLRGRAIESLVVVQLMIGMYNKATGAWSGGWIADLKGTSGATFINKTPATDSSGYGATEAPRGALAHFATTNSQNKITAYQCVVPTTWNGSPRDANGTGGRGPMEQAMLGVPYSSVTHTVPSAGGGGNFTAQGGLEALRVAHTFDPCLACAIH